MLLFQIGLKDLHSVIEAFVVIRYWLTLFSTRFSNATSGPPFKICCKTRERSVLLLKKVKQGLLVSRADLDPDQASTAEG